jgi:D-inositol-3-phosphate glycosyltransferase
VKFINGVRVIHVTAGPPHVVPKEELLPYMDEFARRMIAMCKRQRRPYDVVHANFWTSGVVAMRLKAELGLPFAITFHALGQVRRLHQGESDRFPPERVQIEAQIISAADCVVAECRQDRDDLMQLYGANPAKIRIAPCGFDHSEFWPIDKHAARQELGFSPNERIVLQLGRLVPRKGIDTVVRALGRLRRAHRLDTTLVVVGGETDDPSPAANPEIARLHQVAIDEGVAGRVVFTGRRPRHRLRYYYSAADVFVTTPWYEPFGITPVEAMACGTPVIGACVGGIKTTVRHGRTGFLVPPRDPDAVAQRVAELYRDPSLIQRFGSAGREHVLRHFTWAQVADRMEAIYTRAATGDTGQATRHAMH